MEHRQQLGSRRNTLNVLVFQKMVAVPLLPCCLLITTFQLCLLRLAHGGAYYGHKQPPQQHQPLPQYNDGYPQQQFLGNEMPHLPYGNEAPLQPHYGKEFPQLPLQMGKERLLTDSKGEVNEQSSSQLLCAFFKFKQINQQPYANSYSHSISLCLQDQLSPEDLKARSPPFPAEKVSERGRKEFRARRDQQDPRDRKVPPGCRAKDCQVCRESRGPLVLRATQE